MLRPFRKRVYQCSFNAAYTGQCALVKAEELAKSNWTEIKHLYGRIDQLTAVLVNAGVTIPEEL